MPTNLYEPWRVPVFNYRHARIPYAALKDSLNQNVILESIPSTTDQGGAYLAAVKRPGLTKVYDNSTTNEGRGVHIWRGDIYHVIGTAVYKNGSSIGTLSTSTGKVSFSEDNDGTLYLVLQTGNTIYTVDTSGTLTSRTPPSNAVTAGIQPGIVYLDTYQFIVDRDGVIYSSAAGNPTSWSNTNNLQGFQYYDRGVGISRHLNYIVLHKEHSTEFFYNAGNVNNPLGRVDGAAIQHGCVHGNMIANADNLLFWVGTNINGGRYVVMLEGLAPRIISDAVIDRYLEREDNFSACSFYTMRIAGHQLVIINLTTEGVTLVYNTSTQAWTMWKSEGSQFHGFWGTHNYVVGLDTGKLYELDPGVFEDDEEPIAVRILTDTFDAGNKQSKFLHRLVVVSDKYSTTNPIILRWSDDDFQTWSNNKDLDLRNKIYFANLGRFTSRAFDIQHTANQPLRIQYLEMYAGIGPYAQGGL